MSRFALYLCSFLALSLNAYADEKTIRDTLEALLNVKVKEIHPAERLNLFEVYADGHILYTDENAKILILGGELIDTQTKKNLTSERLAQLSAIPFSELKLENAIKQVRGNGKRTLATFEDPNCGYCKRLATELQEVKDATLYVFLYPILGENSMQRSKNIWCAEDRAKTWNEWMINGVEPPAKECDVAALTENREFGKRNNISGTPTIFFASGKRVSGMMPTDKINETLDEEAPAEKEAPLPVEEIKPEEVKPEEKKEEGK